MKKAFIKSYGATISRRASDGNAGMDVRYIHLYGEDHETGENLGFTISFYETETGDMGNYHGGSGVAVGLPLREYADMYHMLQTEHRIFAQFEVAENNKVIWFNMGTNDNRVGGETTNPY